MKNDLFSAINENDVDSVRNIFKSDPSVVRTAGPGGWPAIHLAAYSGKIECLKILLDCGAYPEIRSENENCNTPLHAAVAGGQVESVKFLVNQGANLNARYARGTQVLHEAAVTGRVEIVRVLMELGADKSITNDDGKTPAEVAESRGHETIAALLRE